MKLALFSGSDMRSNRDLLSKMFGNKKNLSVAYIPSWHDGEEVKEDFKNFSKKIKSFTKKVNFYSLEKKLSKQEKKDLLSNSIIYIDGGNTFLLLSWIRKNNLLDKLQKFARKNILAGQSAGAIIMTNNIKLAEIPSFTADDNFEKIKNYKALNLTKFEFSPHYEGSDREDFELIKYSKKINRIIYACSDESGIFVNGSKAEFSGPGTVVQFFKGIKVIIRD